MCITCASHDDGGWSWHVSIVFSSRLDNHHTGAMTDSLRFYCFMLLPSLSTALQQVGCIAGTLSYLGGSAMTSVTCKLSAWDASASGREKKLLQRCPTGCPLWHWSRVGHMQACRLMSCALSVVSELSALQTFLFYLVKLWHILTFFLRFSFCAPWCGMCFSVAEACSCSHLYAQLWHASEPSLTWGIVWVCWLAALCSTNIARSSARAFSSFSQGLD